MTPGQRKGSAISRLRKWLGSGSGHTLWIVSGPSSAGKTHLISSPRLSELTSLERSAPVLFPAKLPDEITLESDSYLHYNLLRPAQQAVNADRDPAEALDFSGDEAWAKVLATDAEVKALILVADIDTLKERSGGRDFNEPDGALAYKRDKWLALYDRVDLDALYSAWRAELDSHGFPYVEVDSTEAGFPVLRAA